jgi:hypothetical protein
MINSQTDLIMFIYAGLCIGVIASAFIVIELTPFIRKAKAAKRQAAKRRRNKAKAFVVLPSNI